MFPIDRAALPSLPTRKALLLIDFQSDFLDHEGRLPVTEPEGFVDKTLDLAKDFRKKGFVFWVCTEFDKQRPLTSEPIIVSDQIHPPAALASLASRRSTRSDAAPAPAPAAETDPEAFLSAGGEVCVRDAAASQVPARIKESLGRHDISFIKSHYSAFKSGQLLQLLRGKLVTELYLCGSLSNIGVHATAVDAAMYGYDITIVEDCCGYRSDMRHNNAIQSMVDTAGCSTVEKDQVFAVGATGSSPRAQPKGQSIITPNVPVAVDEGYTAGFGGAKNSPKTKTSELHEDLAALNISDGPTPAHQTQPRQTSSDSSSGQAPLEVDLAAQPSSSDGGLRATETPITTETCKSHVKELAPKNRDGGEVTADKTPMARELSNPSLAKLPAGSSARNGPVVESKPNTGSKASTQASPVMVPTNDKIEEDEASAPSAPSASEPYCEGDTTIIHNVLPATLVDGIFGRLRDEVRWQRMSHQGGDVPRLVAVQGDVSADGSMPVYRHPSDESPLLLPFSPAVRDIKAEVEEQVGHPVNHVLIQFYRDGTDYISEHSDKTLDIVKGSYISNVSLGAERTMVFRTKRRDKDPSSTEPPSQDGPKRKIQRAKLPHNSLCRMGLASNMRWLHAIRQDKRTDREKSSAELAFSGGRISLTFRNIGTFLNRDGTLIWGQGATGKTKDQAGAVINGQCDEAVSMLRGFGTENHSSEFDWDKHYGRGFDVLHMSNSPRLFYSSDAVVNLRIRLMLAELGITYAKGSMSPSFNLKESDGLESDSTAPAPGNLPVKFVDNDTAKSVVQGDVAIMLYLEAVYGDGNGNGSSSGKSPKLRAPPESARVLTRFQQGLTLLGKWRALGVEGEGEAKRTSKPLKRELALWDGYASEGCWDFIAGEDMSLADFAAWPVLHDIVSEVGPKALDGTEALKKYYDTVLARSAVVNLLVANRPAAGGNGAE